MLQSVNFFSQKYNNNLTFTSNESTRQLIEKSEEEDCFVPKFVKIEKPKNYKEQSPAEGMSKGLIYSSCSARKRFQNEHKALYVISLMEEKQPGVRLHSYFCDLCHGWHIGRDKSYVRELSQYRKTKGQ